MKTCKVCGQEKDLAEFYKLSKARSNQGDGYDCRCKNCVKEYMHSEKQLAKARIRDAIRSTKPEYIAQKKEYAKEYGKTEQGKLIHQKAQRKYHKTEYGKIKSRGRCKIFQQTDKYRNAVIKHRAKFPERRKAQSAIASAIASKKIVRPDHCSVCDKTCVPHGHHYDYSKPLSVIWVCHGCHVAIHWQSI